MSPASGGGYGASIIGKQLFTLAAMRVLGPPRALYYICNMYYDISFMGFSLS